MASPHHLPRERHILTPNHDFTVVVYDTVHEELTDSNGTTTVEYVPIRAHDYAVSRTILASLPYFRTVFSAGFRDTGRDYYEFPEDDPVSWKVWLQILHGSLDPGSYDVGIAAVWNMLVIADKYEISPKRVEAKEWFATWYKYCGDPQTVDECSQLLYPCHTFDHARGFLRATKLLAYESEGFAGEQRPTGGQVYHLRLDHRITQQLNAARGRLRTILYRELYAPVKKMLEDEEENHCQYEEKVMWAYLKALEQTGVWPSERVSHSNSIDSILSSLRRFICSDPHPDGTTSCFNCKGKFKIDVQKAIDCTRSYFDGLCLDCMNSSKTGDKDKDYWRYLSSKKKSFMHGMSGRYDEGCRMRHDEPSWYFSFMGSRKDYDEWKFARDEERDSYPRF